MQVKAEIINNGDLNRKIFILMAGALGLFVAVYLYFIATITFDVVARKTAENDLRGIRASVGQLELEYLSLNNTIDLAYAESLGFHEATNTYFAKRSGTVAFNTR